MPCPPLVWNRWKKPKFFWELFSMKESGLLCPVMEIEASDSRRLYCTEGFQVSNNPMFPGRTSVFDKQDVQVMIIDKEDELIIQSVNAEDENISTIGKSTINPGDWSGADFKLTGILPQWDIDGQLLPVSEWPESGSVGWNDTVLEGELSFIRIPISELEGEYMAQIQVEDIYGDIYASELIPLSSASGIKTELVDTPEGQLVFKLYDDHAVCCNYIGDETEVEIPEKVGGKTVTKIESGTFSGNFGVSSHDNLRNVILPDSITTIGEKAFCGCSALRDINIPENIEEIGAGAFQDCTSLECIELPKKLSSIGLGAFAGTAKLKEIKIDSGNSNFLIKENALYSIDGKILYAYPAGITGDFSVAEGTEEIRYAAFMDSNLTSITFPASLKIIDDFAFFDSKLSEPPVFPEELEVIGDYAFSCTSWELIRVIRSDNVVQINLGANIKKVGKDAFDLFPFKSFEVDTDNCYFSSVEGNLMSKAGDVLLMFSTRKENIVKIPEGTVEIAPDSMGFNLKLWWLNEEIHILVPDSVARFQTEDMYLYHEDTWIIHCNPGSEAEKFGKENDIHIEYTTDGDVFPESNGEITTETAVIGYELYNDHAEIVYCEPLESLLEQEGEDEVVIELPSTIEGKTVTVVGNGKWSIFEKELYDFESIGRFQGKSCVLIIPEGVTVLSDYAIEKMAEVKLPSSLKVIGNEAISISGICVPLSIPGNVESLGKDFFVGPVVENFEIPTSLKYISPGAFKGCSGLESFSMNGSSELYCVMDGALYSADGTVLIAAHDGMENIPDGTLKIAPYAFSGKTGIKDLHLPASLEEIEDNGMASCGSLERVLFSEGGNLQKIGDKAFIGCDALKEVSLPDSVTELGDAAFYHCISLESVELSENMTKIPYSLFNGCEKLGQIQIPEQVTYIDDYAFADCESLREIILPAEIKDIGGFVFEGDENIVIKIDQDNPYFEIKDGFLIDCRKRKLIACVESVTGVVRVPEDIVDIGTVFDDVEGVNDMYLPSSIRKISFLPDGHDYVLHGTKGSYVERYAVENELGFEATN